MIAEGLINAFHMKGGTWHMLEDSGKRPKENEELGRQLRATNLKVASCPQAVPEATYQQYVKEADETQINFHRGKNYQTGEDMSPH